MSEKFDLTQMNTGPSPKRKGVRRQDDPLRTRVSRSQVTAVSSDAATKTPKSVKAGDYERQTITLPPAQRKHIKKLAEELGVSMFDLYRWLIDQGLQAYDSGSRPEAAEVKHTGIVVGHWSSK